MSASGEQPGEAVNHSKITCTLHAQQHYTIADHSTLWYMKYTAHLELREVSRCTEFSDAELLNGLENGLPAKLIVNTEHLKSFLIEQQQARTCDFLQRRRGKRGGEKGEREKGRREGEGGEGEGGEGEGEKRRGGGEEEGEKERGLKGEKGSGGERRGGGVRSNGRFV